VKGTRKVSITDGMLLGDWEILKQQGEDGYGNKLYVCINEKEMRDIILTEKAIQRAIDKGRDIGELSGSIFKHRIGCEYGVWVVIRLSRVVKRREGKRPQWNEPIWIVRHKITGVECEMCSYQLNKVESKDYRVIIHSYKHSARKRGCEWGLTDEQVVKLFQSPCYYCGTPYEESMSVYNVHGIDRVDSMKGYVVGNVVTCCQRCNIMKGHLGYHEFLQHIKKINQHRAERSMDLFDRYGETSTITYHWYVSKSSTFCLTEN